MKKIAKCKACGGDRHYAISCRITPQKPIKRAPTPRKVVKAKVTKVKTKTRSQAKKAAWEAFSRYIRLRDSIATTGTTDNCICITCNERGDSAWKPYRHIQAGHAVGGRGNAVLFHEEIVNGQCDYCNQKPPFGLGGDYGNYAIALVKRYGLDYAQSLQRLKGTEKVYKLHDFIEVERIYKEKTIDLMAKPC